MSELKRKAQAALRRLESAKGYALFLREALAHTGYPQVVNIWAEKLQEAQFEAHRLWTTLVPINFDSMTETELVLFTAQLNEQTAVLQSTILNAASNAFRKLDAYKKEYANA